MENQMTGLDLKIKEASNKGNQKAVEMLEFERRRKNNYFAGAVIDRPFCGAARFFLLIFNLKALHFMKNGV